MKNYTSRFLENARYKNMKTLKKYDAVPILSALQIDIVEKLIKIWKDPGWKGNFDTYLADCLANQFG